MKTVPSIRLVLACLIVFSGMLDALESNPSPQIVNPQKTHYAVHLGDLSHFVENIGPSQGADFPTTFHVFFTADDFRNQYGDAPALFNVQ